MYDLSEIDESLALQFFGWLHDSSEASSDREALSTGMTREKVGELFRKFRKNEAKKPKQRSKQNQAPSSSTSEGKIMASLRIQKLMRSKRYDGAVICVFAGANGKTFAPIEKRQSARQKLQQAGRELRTDKAGITISEQPQTDLDTDPNNHGSPIVPMNKDIGLIFILRYDGADTNSNIEGEMDLMNIKLVGSHRHNFSVATKPPISLDPWPVGLLIKLTFRTTRIAAHRATIKFCFVRTTVINEKPRYESITILRDVLLRSGDPELYNALEPKTPYTKKKRNKNEKRVESKDIVLPPKDASGRRGGYKGLGTFHIPKNFRRMVVTGELEDALVVPWEREEDFGATYSDFWQNLLWATEMQAYDDIQFFDVENAALLRNGRLLELYVSGLAEGRPSVLKGDLVNCKWNSKEYRGRVVSVGQVGVLLEFDSSFHRSFDVHVDRVERVRFTFGRTPFRTAHAGILDSPRSMGKSMLMPSLADVEILTTRTCPARFKWTSTMLNGEQQQAVREIVKGSMRPLPYIIFGPPGTGKTTTMVEAIYQLAKLRNYGLKILVIAPSNDATDILVEKLSQYFPPSEMVRVLAYTRSIDQVPETVRKYCAEGMEGKELISKILGVQITVATINMASRLWCTGDGLPKGHFDVTCVDEAGHATEPEVIAAVSKIMAFHKFNDNGQLVLAGDPMQLGPIVTSDLCKTFQMDRSYMERLVQTSPAYRLEDNFDQYPPQLVTLLIKNYRSHPQILKLPNEMFYRNQLIACGDIFTTHSMAKWEHLPTKGFPMVFHAVDGENTREGNSPSWFNPQEAMIVVDYVKKLVKESKPKIRPEDIGIITPYARQVQKIRLALKMSGIEDVKVGSVETFQGQERRVIIISTVRSENSLLQHDRKFNLGFVANEKRFNVAVTRAKALLIVVGNPRVLETDTKNWLPLLQFCKSKNSWMGEDWDEAASSLENESDEEEITERMDALVIGDGNIDKDEWAAAAQEAYCFINREE